MLKSNRSVGIVLAVLFVLVFLYNYILAVFIVVFGLAYYLLKKVDIDLVTVLAVISSGIIGQLGFGEPLLNDLAVAFSFAGIVFGIEKVKNRKKVGKMIFKIGFDILLLPASQK